ncbi:hypothetical protein EIN_409060 [Entamoeba invadens IP1]|uniref:FACT complex subunit n=1 Tax=Entamoeba invadens IP1 TaxID=370355 RepID=A0A0A1TWP6_ENTIV|nr:hypothetical protein EIN_409060 [Entamoeba invadens IP1]ELP85617.1 hypothetical protein EIN_409060 [Entamoeba invadens IP1]|eukprot:XP_004184963.1 hypothetical protein EIN_409060 [Entamoeba invadens IP1]
MNITAAQLACVLVKRRFAPKMKDVLETEDSISHTKIVDFIKSGVHDEKIKKEVPTAESATIDASVLSGKFTHTWPPVTSEGNLHDDIIFVYVKVAIDKETAIVARTYGVDPTKELKHTYTLLLKLEQDLALKYKAGVTVEDKVVEVNDLSQKVDVIKGENTLKEGDVISIRVWSGQLMIVNTYFIGAKTVCMTKFVPSNTSSVFFSFKEEEEVEALPKFREKKTGDNTEEEKLKEYEMQRKEMREEFKPKIEVVKKEKVDPTCYTKEIELPKKKPNYIASDVDKFALLLPVGGRLVPFHVNYIKSVTTREGFFRVNFNVPRETEEGTTYIKELSFHVKDPERIATIERDYKEMKKKWTEEEKIRSVRGVKEEKLVIRRENVPVLRAVGINPVLKGKKTEGNLEAHMNGFKFTSNGGNVEIMFNNIRHAFYQNGDKETVILIHLFLDPPVIIQNKAYSHIQFYNEIMDVSLNIDRSDHYYSEADELREEEREKRIRAKYNHLYNDFMGKLKELKVPVLFEIPFRELRFNGTIKRNTATMQPTVNCLINITDAPYKVIELETIDIVVFERLSRNLTLKNFDMVVIFKDHNKPVLPIGSVSKVDLDHIKKWLTKCDIKTYETPQSLNWTNIMETVNSDQEHFEENGWSFLNPDNGSEDSEEEEQVYEAVDDGDDEEDLSTDLSSEEDDESSSEEEEDDSGESWSDLEKQAMKDDMVKDREEHEMFGREKMIKQRERTQKKYVPQRTTTIQNFFKKTTTAPTRSSAPMKREPIKMNKAFVPQKKETTFSLSGGVKRGPPTAGSYGKRKP